MLESWKDFEKYMYELLKPDMHSCEKEYEMTRYIKEFWGTITSTLYIIVGLNALRYGIKYMLPIKYKITCASIIFLGIISMVYHITLSPELYFIQKNWIFICDD